MSGWWPPSPRPPRCRCCGLVRRDVVSGVMLIPMGLYMFIMAGSPFGMQKVDGQLPGLPARFSALLPSFNFGIRA